MPIKRNPKDAAFLIETAMELRSNAIRISVHLGSFLKKGHSLRAETDAIVKAATILEHRLRDEFPEAL